MKVKAEFGQVKKETQEKQKNESQQGKDTEQINKTLKEKTKELKNELIRKEEKLSESDARVRKLEEQMKTYMDTLKSQEESNKQLKTELRKKQAVKEKKETLPTQEDAPQPVTPKVEGSAAGDKPKAPLSEISLITLIAQREKLCRDDLTAMMLAGEESLRMLIREPSDQLIDFIRANLHDEDAILSAIPRFEMPKTDFETQVLREMRIVLKDSAENIL